MYSQRNIVDDIVLVRHDALEVGDLHCVLIATGLDNIDGVGVLRVEFVDRLLIYI